MPQEREVYLNGKLVSEADARISIFDSALMFGDMVFEMTRTFNGQPFRLREHLERLYVGLRLLEIDCGLSLDDMEVATHRTIEINRPSLADGVDVQIMHDVSRGALGPYRPILPEGGDPTVTISCWPLITHLGPVADKYETGVHAVVPAQRSIPARLVDPKIKSRSRIHYQVANLQARRVDAEAWALLTDEDGFITEGPGANCFVVHRGKLMTPEPRNILRGVTRKATMELALDLGIECEERNLELYDVATADEAFFTSTSFVLLPVTRFEWMPIGTGVAGPVTRRLIQGWNDMVGLDIPAQAKRYAEQYG